MNYNMRCRIIFLAITLMMSLCVWAETPEECMNKHRDRVCIFVNPTPYETEMTGFNIERVAINKSATNVYVKITQNNDDIVFPIKDMTRGGRLLMVLSLEDGGLLVVTEDFDVMYQDSNGKGALFRYDQDKTLKYQRISKKD